VSKSSLTNRTAFVGHSLEALSSLVLANVRWEHIIGASWKHDYKRDILGDLLPFAGVTHDTYTVTGSLRGTPRKK
jgi:hypothetical protein